MKTPCEIIKDLLPLYCDGICSEESKKTVEEHLQSCADCKEELRLMNFDISSVNASENDERIVKAAATAWKKGKKKAFFKGCLIMVSAVIILVCGYVGFHWFSTADGNDIDALTKQATDYTAEKYSAQNELYIEKMTQRGNFMAALCSDNDNKQYIIIYDRDNLFESRWDINRGYALEKGTMYSWNLGERGDAILIFYGVELPDEAYWYTFQNDRKIYTCPIENKTVLDIFIILDNNDIYDINGLPVLLDENKQPINYE